MKKRFHLTSLIALLALPLLIFSCTQRDKYIYVSPDGDDNGSGNKNNPFASVHRAQKEAREVIKQEKTGTLHIVFNDGTYSLQKPLELTDEDSGNEELKIIYQAAPGASPIFSGGRILEKPQTENEIWKWILPFQGDQLYDLYVNGKRATRARTPNTGFIKMGKVDQEIIEKGEGRVAKRAQQTIKMPTSYAQELNQLSKQKLQKVRFQAFFKWDNSSRYFNEKGNDPHSFTTIGKGMKPWNSMGKGTRFFLENYRAALDANGEWFATGNELLYKPLPSEANKNPLITAPVLEHLLIVKGDSINNKWVKNIEFKGIEFSYSNYNLPQSGFEPAQAAATIDAALMLDGARNISFSNCNITHTGQHGIWFRKGCQNCSMIQCYLQDLGAGGIRIGEAIIREKENNKTHHITIENCIIQSGGYNFPSAVGVWIGQSGHNNITHNDIADFRYTGVSVGWIWGYNPSPAKNNKILYNHIHHIGWALLSDMAGVYTLGISEGTEVSHNIVHDIHAYSYGGWGLYTDEGSSHIMMEKNLVYNTKTGGFHQHYGKENTIRNNIFAFAHNFQVQATRVEKHRSFNFTNNIIIGKEGVLLAGPWEKIDIEMDHNCYWYQGDKSFDFVGKSFLEWQKTGHDQNSLVQNPGILDFEMRNLQLDPQVTKVIAFEPLDISKAGVYGDNQWKEKAKLPKSIVDQFKKEVQENLNSK